MASTGATAEVFWTAFQSLAKKDRRAFLKQLLNNRELREDLIDLTIIRQREKEISRPLGVYLAQRAKRKA
jgi:hypothetical protein